MIVKNWIPHHLQDRAELANIWLASTLPKKTFLKYCPKRNVQAIDLSSTCNGIRNSTVSNTDNIKAQNFSTTSRLITGILQIAEIQDDFLLDEIEGLLDNMTKLSTKSKSKDPVEDFPEVVIDMPVVEEDELVMIQYSPQHMRTITMDENPLFYKDDISMYDEPINNLEFSRDIVRQIDGEITQRKDVIGEESEEFFIDKSLSKTTKRKAQSESFSETAIKRPRIINNDYELPDDEPCVSIPVVEEPSIPDETIHENIKTVQQEKTIVTGEQAATPDVVVDAEKVGDNASSIDTDTPRQRPKKSRSIINEIDTIPVETLATTFKNIQLRVLNFDDCSIGDVQLNHNTLVNLKRYPGYIGQDKKFIQVSPKVQHYFLNNVMIPRANTTLDHQRRQETQQNIFQDELNFRAANPVQDNTTLKAIDKSDAQVFPVEAFSHQQENNLNTAPELTIDSLPAQDIVNNNVQLADTQLVTSTQDDSEQQVTDQHDLNINDNVNVSVDEDELSYQSPDSIDYIMTKIDVEERLNMCREKNFFPLNFYDLFPSEIDSKNDVVIGFYHLLDTAGENGNEWNLYQNEQFLIEDCSKDFSFLYY